PHPGEVHHQPGLTLLLDQPVELLADRSHGRLLEEDLGVEEADDGRPLDRLHAEARRRPPIRRNLRGLPPAIGDGGGFGRCTPMIPMVGLIVSRHGSLLLIRTSELSSSTRLIGRPRGSEAVTWCHLGTFPKTMLGDGRPMRRIPAFSGAGPRELSRRW